MAFTKTFPYDTGTFVITYPDEVDINIPQTMIGILGTISCYQCVSDKEDDLLVVVSGYKEPWCGEYLLDKIRLAKNEEVAAYEKLMEI